MPDLSEYTRKLRLNLITPNVQDLTRQILYKIISEHLIARLVCSSEKRTKEKLQVPETSEYIMTDIKPFQIDMIETNISKAHISKIETKNTQYEQLLADVWVGIVLTLLLLSCVCCMCSCMLYHKFQQWKRSVLRNNEEPDIGSLPSTHLDCESLPSYTIASGLPTYEEAVQQMKADRKTNKKLGSMSKESSNASLQSEIPHSTSKTSMISYLQSFVHEKT